MKYRCKGDTVVLFLRNKPLGTNIKSKEQNK